MRQKASSGDLKPEQRSEAVIGRKKRGGFTATERFTSEKGGGMGGLRAGGLKERMHRGNFLSILRGEATPLRGSSVVTA